tara:strand:+ start:294 stop:566 length:273 start_codon:yes stop_codon:yes gene_type:complete
LNKLNFNHKFFEKTMTSLPKIKDISSLFGGLSVDDTSDIDSLIDSMEDISLERELPKNVYMLDGKLVVWNPRFDISIVYCYDTGNVVLRI